MRHGLQHDHAVRVFQGGMNQHVSSAIGHRHISQAAPKVHPRPHAQRRGLLLIIAGALRPANHQKLHLAVKRGQRIQKGFEPLFAEVITDKEQHRNIIRQLQGASRFGFDRCSGRPGHCIHTWRNDLQHSA